MQAMGATQSQINQHLGHLHADDDCLVLEENWAALGWFLDVDDLFRYQDSVCLGLDVLAVKADADMLGRQYETSDYKALRHIAKEAASQLNQSLMRRSKV